MASEDYYGTRSMRLYQWSLRQEIRLRDFYEQKVGSLSDSVDPALDYLKESLEDKEDLTAENSIEHLERDE